MAYTNKGAIQNYLMVDIDGSFDAQIERWIEAAKGYIDSYVGKTFEAGSETRYFDGSGEGEQVIDPAAEITSVEILELNGTDVEFALTEGQDDDYIKYPYNGTPTWKLIMTPNSRIGYFPSGKKRIKIVGKFGQSTAVPADIELAATILVSAMVEKGLKGGQVSSESLGDYSVSFKGDPLDEHVEVKEILDRYKIWEL